VNSVRSLYSGLVVLVLVALVSGCSNLSVKYDYDQNVDWAKFKTFGWIQNPHKTTDPTSALQDTPLLEQRIRNSVDYEMRQRGITPSDSPDLQVAYFVGAKDKIQVTDWGYRYSDYYWGYGGRQIDVYQFTEGSLVIDLVDAQTHQLVWRGTGTKVIDDSPMSPEEMQQRVDKVVHKIMESFPPH